MGVLYGDKAIPMFCDTGWEHDEMYERIDFVQKRLSEIHEKEIKIIRIAPTNIQGTGAKTLPEYIKIAKFYPGPMARFCTRLGKIEPMDKYLSTLGPCRLAIGLNYDEADERVGNYGKCENVTYEYPLVDDKITRPTCEAILKHYGLMPKFKAYMTRGGCKGCFFKGKKEYAAMALQSPKEAYEVAELEEAIQDKRGEYYHIHGDIPNMRRFIEETRQQNLIPPDEMYSQKPDTMTTSCGVFCHR